MKRFAGLFLGAGASAELGMPLAWELTAEIKNWLTANKLQQLNEGWKTQGGGYQDVVLNDLISILARPEVHYEAALGFIEAQFRRQRALAQQYHGLYSWLVDLVYHLLWFRQVNNASFLSRRLPDYDGLTALVDSSAPLWIFSLNHDVMVEAIAARLSIPIYSGFSDETVSLPRRNKQLQKIGEVRAQVLTGQELDLGAMQFPNPPKPGIYLLKVHGALDVFTFNDGKDLLKLIPDGSGPAGVIDVLRAANEDLFYPLPGMPGGRAKTTNEIAYADEQGEMQFLRRSLLAGAFKFDQRASQVLPLSLLKHFKANINFVSDLACIGYAFGDNHINAVLREWLEFSPERQLEIIDPISPNIPAFLLHLAPQIKLTKSFATDYLDERAGIVRPRRATLEKRAVAALRKLGKERAYTKLGSFLRQEKSRIAEGLKAKIEALPLDDGKPSVEGLGPPDEIAGQWASEIELSDEDALDRLLSHLERQDGS
ncbi:MAG: hypothetical protein P4L72_04095 [Parvibaculum sp.]|uniref:hypothetical protein n=1 Tax=Parvibaculum sp. TaxID=2024848 RepID=UPI0028465953|nr:hypothetical protein [Parvibaculum sp.]MDR3498390.1 hypothetical protein [Parvibaculum sp.]